MDQQHLPLDPSPIRVPVEAGCGVELHEGFVTDHGALARDLIERLPWVQELYWRDGRAIPAPRLTSFHGEQGLRYRYSGQSYLPAAWTESLLGLRARISRRVGCRLNCVLINYYRDGQDSVGYHADAEPELGPRRDDIVIGSLSLGTPRRFVLKPRRGGDPISLQLGNGSLLVMRGRTQQRYLHAIPKTRRPVGARVNLTFRVVLPSPP